MSPRSGLTAPLTRALRRPGLRPPRIAPHCCYSTAAHTQPLIVATDLAAPNSGYIRILELNRPTARNAISRALLSSLRDHVDAVHAQYDAAGNEIVTGVAGEASVGPTRALIIASAVDSSFCAGADLKERRGFTPEE